MRLGVRGLRFNHFFRGGQLHYRGGVPLDAARVLAPVMQELGWHLQLWIDVKDLPDTIPILQSLGLPVVIDHMGRSDARAGTGHSRLCRACCASLGEGGCWVKLSGAHRISRARRIIRTRGRSTRRWLPRIRTVWSGAATGRIRAWKGEMPDVGHLLDLFTAWTPDAAIRQRILVTNPQRLYGFRRGRDPVVQPIAPMALSLSPKAQTQD